MTLQPQSTLAGLPWNQGNNALLGGKQRPFPIFEVEESFQRNHPWLPAGMVLCPPLSYLCSGCAHSPRHAGRAVTYGGLEGHQVLF